MISLYKIINNIEDAIKIILQKNCNVFVVKDYYYVFYGCDLLYKCKTDFELINYLSRIDIDKKLYEKREKDAYKWLQMKKARQRRKRLQEKEKRDII